jgi:hypothetical protein
VERDDEDGEEIRGGKKWGRMAGVERGGGGWEGIRRRIGEGDRRRIGEGIGG